MSSMSSDSISLLAEAILCLGAGNPLPSAMTDALRMLSPAAEPEPVAATEPVVEPPPVLPPLEVKEKKIRKTNAAIAAATGTAATGTAATGTAATGTADAAPAAVTGGDPWRTHPSRLAVINPKCCMGRRIDEKNPLAGTCPGDTGSNRRKVFPETQCKSKPVPGSKLCAGCTAKDAAFKANPNTKDESWYGRLDEESLYPRAKIVGCKYFLDKYPNGIHNDSFRPGAAPAAAAAVTAAPAAEPKKRGPKKATAPTTAVATAVTFKTAAVDIAPVNATYKSFMHEGRLHVRNLETNKVYYANIANNSPEENAVKEQYVGRWADGTVDLIDDSDDE